MYVLVLFSPNVGQNAVIESTLLLHCCYVDHGHLHCCSDDDVIELLLTVTNSIAVIDKALFMTLLSVILRLAIIVVITIWLVMDVMRNIML